MFTRLKLLRLVRRGLGLIVLSIALLVTQACGTRPIPFFTGDASTSKPGSQRYRSVTVGICACAIGVDYEIDCRCPEGVPAEQAHILENLRGQFRAVLPPTLKFGTLNMDGQLGWIWPLPAPLLPQGNYVQISDGLGQICALSDDGRAVSYTDEPGIYGTNVPPPSRTFRSIACNGNIGCGLTDDRQLFCWDGGFTETSEAATLMALFPDQRFLSVVMAGDYFCGTTPTSGTLCAYRFGGQWSVDVSASEQIARLGLTHIAISGHNWDQLICGIDGDKQPVCFSGENVTRYPLPADQRLLQISAFYDGICGVSSANQVHCWGSASGLFH